MEGSNMSFIMLMATMVVLSWRSNIKGEYHVHLPDGRVQHVIYHADGNYGGTIMEVKYDGEAHHPDYHGHGGHGHHVHGGVGGGHGIVG